MAWSPLHRQSPGTRQHPGDDQPPKPAPLLARPFEGGALILIAALLARRSRIAAWAAIPAALAGCQLATYVLNQVVLYYHLGT